MENSQSFKTPIVWKEIAPEQYDGLYLGGGHAPGMKQYLESKVLQEKITAFWKLKRPVAAICHGVLLLSRTQDPETGKSVLYEKKTTTLTKQMENIAYMVSRWQYGKLYRTYEVIKY
jgi:putative intracellular protease/amidase